MDSKEKERIIRHICIKSMHIKNAITLFINEPVPNSDMIQSKIIS